MSPTIRRGGRLIIAALAVYWLAMFAGTHVSHSPEVSLHTSDKLLHFSGYLGLAFLLVCWWRMATPRQKSNRPATVVVAVVLIAAVYGALDEVTQIPVGRDCDFFDWLADVSGATIGALLASAVIAVRRRLGPAKPPSDAALPPMA